METKHIINYQYISYDIIFGSAEAQEVIAKAYHIILKARDDLLENGE